MLISIQLKIVFLLAILFICERLLINPNCFYYIENIRWISAQLPANEEARLAELEQYEVLDTNPEVVFDRLTRMAAKFFDVPIALVSLIDLNRQWFKSRYGIDATETPRELAFCAHAILENEVFVVPDATLDYRFADNPLVKEAPDIRFYAGAPLRTKSGFNLGTICVIDTKPHHDITEKQKQDLSDLAAIVIDELELRMAVKKANHDLDELKKTQSELEESRRKAEIVSQEKSQFIATISHELRTPMNGILGMAYLLNDTKTDNTQKEYIETINHSASNLLLLINDVLDLS
ncbi:MAG: histidine kinase dimerization/phospho-acceptor domain-containing protein, partial [Pseudomonadota bacterium]